MTETQAAGILGVAVRVLKYPYGLITQGDRVLASKGMRDGVDEAGLLAIAQDVTGALEVVDDLPHTRFAQATAVAQGGLVSVIIVREEGLLLVLGSGEGDSASYNDLRLVQGLLANAGNCSDAQASLGDLALRDALVGVVLTDPNGVVTFANKAAADLTGRVDSAAFVGMRLLDALKGTGDSGDGWEPFQMLLDGFSDHYVIDKVYARGRMGDAICVVRTSVLRSDDGATLGTVSFIEDITSLRRSERQIQAAMEQAHAASAAKSMFLANMSHELRTPLNSVIGFTNVLLKNGDGNLTEKQIGYLEKVRNNGRHLLDLINDVLDLSKVEAGKTEPIIEAVDVAEMVRSVVGTMEGRVLDSPVRLIADVPDEALIVQADSGMLKQVLINLIGNSVKFTETGEIRVSVRRHPGGKVESIAVQDTGIGIPEDRLGAIFHAFEQVDNRTSRKFGGTGLGLALCQRFAGLMGMEIIVTSTLGVGSTFRIVMSHV